MLKKALVTVNDSPQISVPSTFNVTVSEMSTLTVNASDPNGDNVALTLRTDLPPGATFDNYTGVFMWTPVDTTPVNIS